MTTVVNTPDGSDALFDSATPGGSSVVDDGSGVTLGVQFYLPAADKIAGILFYRSHASASASGTVALYAVGNTTPLVTKAYSGHSGVGWRYVAFDTPYDAAANTAYLAAYFAPGVSGKVYYQAQSGAYTTTRTSTGGKLVAPANGTGGYNNGLFNYASAAAYPVSQFNQSDYKVSPVVPASAAAGIAGALVATDQDDGSASTAVLAIKGQSASTEGGDGLVSTASLGIRAAATPSEANDGLAATGVSTPAPNTGAAVLAEAGDTLVAAAAVASPGASALLLEADDSVASAARLTVSAFLSISEADDASSSDAALKLRAAGALIEAGDTVVSTIQAPNFGSLATNDNDDLLTAYGTSVVGATPHDRVVLIPTEPRSVAITTPVPSTRASAEGQPRPGAVVRREVCIVRVASAA